MSLKQTIRCDTPGCTRVRGEGNKWFSVNRTVLGNPYFREFYLRQ